MRPVWRFSQKKSVLFQTLFFVFMLSSCRTAVSPFWCQKRFDRGMFIFNSLFSLLCLLFLTILLRFSYETFALSWRLLSFSLTFFSSPTRLMSCLRRAGGCCASGKRSGEEAHAARDAAAAAELAVVLGQRDRHVNKQTTNNTCYVGIWGGSELGVVSKIIDVGCGPSPNAAGTQLISAYRPGQ
jgi:hypothetical protein